MLAMSAGGAVVLGVAAGVVVLAIGVWLFSRCVKIVQQGSVGVVKRLGEFRAVSQPGMHVRRPSSTAW